MTNNKIFPVGWASLKGRIDIYSPEIIKLHKLAYDGDREARLKLEHLLAASRRLINEIYLLEGSIVLLDVNNQKSIQSRAIEHIRSCSFKEREAILNA